MDTSPCCHGVSPPKTRIGSVASSLAMARHCSNPLNQSWAMTAPDLTLRDCFVRPGHCPRNDPDWAPAHGLPYNLTFAMSDCKRRSSLDMLWESTLLARWPGRQGPNRVRFCGRSGQA